MTRLRAWGSWLAFPLVQLAELAVFVLALPIMALIVLGMWIHERR